VHISGNIGFNHLLLHSAEIPCCELLWKFKHVTRQQGNTYVCRRGVGTCLGRSLSRSCIVSLFMRVSIAAAVFYGYFIAVTKQDCPNSACSASYLQRDFTACSTPLGPPMRGSDTSKGVILSNLLTTIYCTAQLTLRAGLLASQSSVTRSLND
jgi:hypothetical protein